MASGLITLTQGTTSLILSLTGSFCHPQLFCFWVTLSTSHHKVFLPQHHHFCWEWWDVLGSEGQISKCFNKETIVEVFHDFLLSTCLNLSSLISLFHLEGELSGVVWGKRKRKPWEKRIVERTKSSVNSKAVRLETGQNHCPTGSRLQIPVSSLLKRTVQNFSR